MTTLVSTKRECTKHTVVRDVLCCHTGPSNYTIAVCSCRHCGHEVRRRVSAKSLDKMCREIEKGRDIMWSYHAGFFSLPK